MSRSVVFPRFFGVAASTTFLCYGLGFAFLVQQGINARRYIFLHLRSLASAHVTGTGL
jgi:hypothetical protein